MFTMAMSAIATSIIFLYRTSGFALQEASAVTSAQHGIDLMMRTIREAAYASNGAYPVVSFSNNSITFYANVDTDSAVEKVHFYVQGTSLYEGTTKPSGSPLAYTGSEIATVIAENVRNLSQGTALFTYYDASGLPITDFTNISGLRFVTANVVVDMDLLRAPLPVTIRSSAAMRNIVGH